MDESLEDLSEKHEEKFERKSFMTFCALRKEWKYLWKG
jgi:hypothetical protein